MINQDRVNALSHALDQQRRDGFGGQNVGGMNINKKDGRKAFGYSVAIVLCEHNGVIQWDMDDPVNGAGVFNNIYEFLGAEMYAPGASIRVRVEAAEQYNGEARSGCASLAEWLDDMWGLPLFRCTSSGSGNRVTTITIDPDFVVDEVTGDTAANTQRKRDVKAIEGQALAARRRIGRQFGDSAAGQALQMAVDSALSDPLPEPKMKQVGHET